MFTGIISHLGKVKGYKNNTFKIEAKKSFCRQIKKGSSVAVNGICLTVKAKTGNNLFEVEVIPETLRRTNFSDLKSGDFVNLELPLIASDRFAGHIVQGHVDGMAVVNNIKREGNSHIFTFKVPKLLAGYIVEKGSIAINGVSLTVIGVGNTYFTVGIIPYTWQHTMFGKVKIGDRVNIEVDILAKYLEKLVKGYLENQNVKKIH